MPRKYTPRQYATKRKLRPLTHQDDRYCELMASYREWCAARG